MRRAGTIFVAIALCLAAIAALPVVAEARIAYFTGSAQGGGYAAPVDLATGAVGSSTPVSTEGPPADVAIAPDGSTAYVAGAADELVRIDVATNAELSPISMSGQPWAIAIAPDGKRAYTANLFESSVSVIDLATGAEVGSAITVGNSPAAIAVTPDGSHAYVANEGDDAVSVIELTTDTVVDTIAVGESPRGVAVTPDGKHVVVANRAGESVSVIDVATGAVAATIATPGVKGEEVAIAPGGSRAYVLSSQEGVAVVDLATNAAGPAVPLAGFAGDIAILPDGSRAFVTREAEEGQSFVHQLVPFDLASDAFGTPFEIGERPEALAIVPNQPPHAAFTASPQSPTAGNAVSFDGSASNDSDGEVARYDWEFGDGSSAANAGATPQHKFAKPGTYQVTLTVTDNEGCSTQVVFTGQTAYCDGSGEARVTLPVTVSGGKCASLSIHATSFKPKVRPGHTVPGVRVRLAPSVPARVEVRATLLRQRNGKEADVDLGKLDVKIRHWRRVRFAIPSKLRDELPLGTHVRVKFDATVRPLDGSTCLLRRKQKPPVLDLRVVKVFPNAVQAARPR